MQYIVNIRLLIILVDRSFPSHQIYVIIYLCMLLLKCQKHVLVDNFFLSNLCSDILNEATESGSEHIVMVHTDMNIEIQVFLREAIPNKCLKM